MERGAGDSAARGAWDAHWAAHTDREERDGPETDGVEVQG